MNHLDLDYQTLLQDILSNGTRKQTRNGEVLSIFGRQIRHKMQDGFPLLTTKKMYFKGIVTELIWFLRGDTNIKYLVDNDCNIWTGDAYKKYTDHFIGYEDVPNQDWFIEQIKTDIEFANRWGDLGPIYGKQWRKWKTFRKVTTNTPSKPTDSVDYIDQIANLINDLKTNPDSRRLMVSAWNVGELDSMVLPPCHFSFQCYSHEKDGKRYLSLAWNQRSIDCGLGLPFNIASYGLLLEIMAKEVSMIPYELIGNLGDCHIYNDHLDGVKEQLNREPYPLPTLNINTEFWQTESGECGLGLLKTNLQGFEISDFTLENYQSHPVIKLPLSN
jgi:thymidylate synthase